MILFSTADQNLEAHGSCALTSIAASGTATIGRSFGHSLRRAMSVRHSTAPTRYSRNVNDKTRSSVRVRSKNRHSNGNLPEENRHSGTFVDLRPQSAFDQDSPSSSNRSSIVSTSSTSTVGSWNPSSTPTLPISSQAAQDKAHHLSTMRRVGSDSPVMLRPSQRSPVSGRKSPLVGNHELLKQPADSDQPPNILSPGSPVHPGPDDSSSSSIDSLDKTVIFTTSPVYNTPL